MPDLHRRTYLRGIALQILYEKDLSSHDLKEILKNRIDAIENSNFEPDELKFIIELVRGVTHNEDDIDARIFAAAPEWPVDQISTIDRNIIRIAVYEFEVGKITPHEVAINESVELAKTFGAESSPRFVNGVLRSMVK